MTNTGGMLSWPCALFQTRSRTGRRAFLDSPRPGGRDRRDVRAIDGIRVDLPRPDRGVLAPQRPRVPLRYRSSRPEICVRANDPFDPRPRAPSRRRRGGRAAEERGRAERRRARVVVVQPRRRHAERPRVAPARRSRRREQRHDLGRGRLPRRSRALGASARRGELHRGSRRAELHLSYVSTHCAGTTTPRPFRRRRTTRPTGIHAGGPAGRPRGVAARRVGADVFLGWPLRHPDAGTDTTWSSSSAAARTSPTPTPPTTRPAPHECEVTIRLRAGGLIVASMYVDTREWLPTRCA